MRELFFNAINDFKFKESYLDKYFAHASHIDTALSIATGLLSAASISAWTIWKQLPFVWSILLMLAQVVQVVRPFLPYSRRLVALKYFIPEMRRLVLDVENCWYESEAEANPDYVASLYAFRKQYIDMSCKYLGSDPLPTIKRLRKAAEVETANHLRLFFGATEGDDSNA